MLADGIPEIPRQVTRQSFFVFNMPLAEEMSYQMFKKSGHPKPSFIRGSLKYNIARYYRLVRNVCQHLRVHFPHLSARSAVDTTQPNAHRAS